MTYCANDVLATHAVFAKLWPEFLERWDQQNHALSLVPYLDFLLERWDQQNHALSLVPYLDFLLKLQHHCTYQQKNWNIAELSERYGRMFGRQKWQSNEDFLITQVETPAYVITDGNSHLPIRWKTQFMLSPRWKPQFLSGNIHTLQGVQVCQKASSPLQRYDFGDYFLDLFLLSTFYFCF